MDPSTTSPIPKLPSFGIFPYPSECPPFSPIHLVLWDDTYKFWQDKVYQRSLDVEQQVATGGNPATAQTRHIRDEEAILTKRFIKLPGKDVQRRYELLYPAADKWALKMGVGLNSAEFAWARAEYVKAFELYLDPLLSKLQSQFSSHYEREFIKLDKKVRAMLEAAAVKTGKGRWEEVATIHDWFVCANVGFKLYDDLPNKPRNDGRIPGVGWYAVDTRDAQLPADSADPELPSQEEVQQSLTKAFPRARARGLVAQDFASGMNNCQDDD